MTNVKERILYFIENQSINKEFFFEKVGLSYSNFKGIQKKSGLNTDALAKILSFYPNINVEWLLTGKGNMLIEINSEQALNDPGATYEIEKKEQTLLLAQQKTINILEREVEDLRDDKQLLKQIINSKLGNANAS